MNIEWIPIVNIIGFITLGLGYLFVQFKMGGRGVSNEVIATYKEQVVQLKEEVQTEKDARAKDRHDLRNQIQGLSLKVANMEGQLTEKDKKIEDLTTIFQGRSPAQDEFMKTSAALGKMAIEYMKRSDERETQTQEALTEIMKALKISNEKGA